MDKVIDKLEKLDDRLDNVDKQLAIYNEQLKIHIKRTELLEKELKPVVEHVSMVKGGVKLISVISMSLGLVLLILKLTDKI